MNIYHNEAEQIKQRQRKTIICYGMHPGGGFVAWPDGSTSFTEEKETNRKLDRCRGQYRKGFVAWPEKE